MAGSTEERVQDHYYEQEQDHHDHVYVQTHGNNGGGESSNNPSNKIDFNQQERGPIGLTLRRTASMINQVEILAQQQQQNRNQQVSAPQAAGVPALFLKIGSWVREARNDGDLVVKFYYRRKKLVWEFVDGSLKKKIEIQWSQVSAISSLADEDGKGRLQIELKEPPEYSQEVNFKPTRHTQWATTDDFTGGQAPICRRHTIVFSPRVLDKPFKKLLQCDNKLFNISLQPFPSHNNPFFCNRIIDFSSNKRLRQGTSPISNYVDHQGTSSSVPIPSYDHQGLTPVPITNNRHQGAFTSVPISTYYDHHQGICPNWVPISNYNHQEASLHYVGNHGDTTSNLAMPAFEFPKSDEVAVRGVWEQGGSSENCLTPIGEQDHLLVLPYHQDHVVESRIQEQQQQFQLTDDRQSCFCTPFKHKYQNEFESGGSRPPYVDQSRANGEPAFNDGISGLPTEARIDHSSSNGSETGYLNQEIFSCDDDLWRQSDGLAFVNSSMHDQNGIYSTVLSEYVLPENS